ncbi:MAG: hypothetical protein A4E48_00077 [Methanosaeta sp. PtaU1.Bin060]|nr:MAG: hypothetical protein A4E45_02077 [Methanosaeta sp. PtaB.Bin039]OPY55388.1 MAG: hypothetical protein A4E48_00077 [Methanosaeta sp. PtaU1.Bin060]
MGLLLLPTSRPGQVAARAVDILEGLLGGVGSALSFDAMHAGGCTSMARIGGHPIM